MRRVDLNGVKPSLHSAHRGILKALDKPLNLLDKKRLGLRVRHREGNCARRPHILRPTAIAFLGGLIHAPGAQGVPAWEVTCLPAGVGELDTCLLALRVDEVDDALDGGDLPVVPEAGVAGGDAPVGSYGGGLEDGQGGAAEGVRAEMHEVEVGHETVFAGVHAHRRDGEAVDQGQGAELEWREEGGHFGGGVNGGADGGELGWGEVRDSGAPEDGAGLCPRHGER